MQKSEILSEQMVAKVQAGYFLFTGIWPIVGINTFQRVTGPKVDTWLVRTVGMLVTVIGAVLARSSRREQIPDEVPLLAIGSAASLAAIDVIYVARKRILPIYLLDAAGELILIAWWILALRSRPKR